MKTIKGNLILKKDTVIKTDLKVEGNIVCEGGRWNLTVEGNIDCGNINCWNIDCWTINCLNIDCGNINCLNIDCWTINCLNIDCLNIDCWNINTSFIVCETRKKKSPKAKTICRNIITGRSKYEKKATKP